MLDNGFPLATESNILKELIKPPNIINRVVNTVTGASKYDFYKKLITFFVFTIVLYICSKYLNIPENDRTS